MNKVYYLNNHLDKANTPELLAKIAHYKNPQPLWAEENLKKGNK